MIIQCPSCSTKFAVDATQLADVDSPRFHCSRCDHFFEISSNAGAESTNEAEGSVQAAEQTDGEPKSAYQLDLLGGRPPEADSPGAKFEELFQPAPTIPPAPSHVPESSSFSSKPSFSEIDEQDAVVADWPDANAARPFEADLSSLHSKLFPSPSKAAAAAPADEAPTPARGSGVSPSDDDELDFVIERGDDGEFEADVDVGGPIVGGPGPLFSDELGVFSKKLEEEPRKRPLPDTKSRAPVRPQIPNGEIDSLPIRTTDSGSFQRYESTPDKTAERPLPPWKRRGLQRKRGRMIPGARFLRERSSVLIASSMPLLMMVGVWGWSLNLAKTPAAIRELLHLDPTGLPQLPPPGLEVVDLQSKLVTLDDGERVLEIRGNILNATMKTFGRVKLEAKIFDQNNNELDRMVVDSHSNISNAKIEALSAEALMDMQKEVSSAFIRLGPNERTPFKVVFGKIPVSDGTEGVQWYSTRIYSSEPAVTG